LKGTTVVDKDTFALYVSLLEETKKARESIEEVLRRFRENMDRHRAKLDEWRLSGPHDPIESLGLAEHSKSFQAISLEMSNLRFTFLEMNIRFDDEFLSRAQVMLAGEDYDLNDLFKSRIEETRRRFDEQLPQFQEYFARSDEALSRFDAFLDDCNSKKQ
jgi:hypothetical protein